MKRQISFTAMERVPIDGKTEKTSREKWVPFIQKPISNRELAVKVREALEG